MNSQQNLQTITTMFWLNVKMNQDFFKVGHDKTEDENVELKSILQTFIKLEIGWET